MIAYNSSHRKVCESFFAHISLCYCVQRCDSGGFSQIAERRNGFDMVRIESGDAGLLRAYLHNK